ncbi:MAG: hypothetical protein OPY03_05020 [Nitrosopumilus sp.]|nr:hypothetical protein [Nitrosopumilus sp.]
MKDVIENKPCFIEGCSDKAYSCGVCKDHYANGSMVDPETGLA